MMSNQAYKESSEEDKKHFIQCGTCNEWIDCRQLDEVFHHEDHVDKPDIQYSGSKKIK